jgi:3-methylfumaryl-CoA hydratase
MSSNLGDLKQWIGKVETLSDRATVTPVRALRATLDCGDEAPDAGAQIPPCWHWLYFLPLHCQSEIGVDGHARRGGFLPPVPLPRRMWAGSRIQFLQPLYVGESITKTSQIADVSSKDGRSGPLVFVRVRHEIAASKGVAIVEEQDIVYRDMPRPNEVSVSKPAPVDEQFGCTITPSPVLLFRYSALTFNGHRIHYDRTYATGEEGYPGLVVHGPLIATLLIGELQRAHPGVHVTTFDFKAVSPLHDTAPFAICGRLDGGSATLWARGPEGQLAMQATATVSHD